MNMVQFHVGEAQLLEVLKETKHALPSFLLNRRKSPSVHQWFHLFPLAASSALPQPPAAPFPGDQLVAQVQGLEHMMQQVVI